MRDLPRSGVEPMSPTWAGGFFITGPPGKPLHLLFIDHISILTSKTFFILRRLVCTNLNIVRKPTFPSSSTGTESVCSAGDPGSTPGSGRSPGEGIGYPLQYSWASLVTQLVKNTPAMCETWVWSLGWEDALEEGVFLPGESPWTEEPGGWQSMGLQRVGPDWMTKRSAANEPYVVRWSVFRQEWCGCNGVSPRTRGYLILQLTPSSLTLLCASFKSQMNSRRG